MKTLKNSFQNGSNIPYLGETELTKMKFVSEKELREEGSCMQK